MENFLEEYLTENIPPDLVKAYKKCAQYDSQRNPNSNHQEFNRRSRSRRFIQWDYGKSTYKVISAEEAIDLVKQDKYNLQKLRILFPKDELVEYEVRDNGATYAIYGNPDRRVRMSVGDTLKEYKNIRYVPWKIALLNANKIYITDEYEHPISAEKEAERRDKEKYLSINDKHTYPGDSEYDPHDAVRNFQKHLSSQKNIPDTGSHIKDPTEADIAKIFQSYSYCRLALKKLEREREDLDADDYEYQKNKLTNKLAELKKQYDEKCKQKKQESDHAVQRIWKDAEDSNKLLLNYLSSVQAALNTAYELKRDIEQLQAGIPSEKIQSRQVSISSEQIEDWKNAITELEKINKHLEELKQQLPTDTNNLSNDIKNASDADKEQLEKKIQDYSEKYELANEEKIKKLVIRLSDLNKQLKDTQAELMNLRPNSTAKKAAKRNAEASLDPSLTDILDFVDFVPNSTEVS